MQSFWLSLGNSFGVDAVLSPSPSPPPPSSSFPSSSFFLRSLSRERKVCLKPGAFLRDRFETTRHCSTIIIIKRTCRHRTKKLAQENHFVVQRNKDKLSFGLFSADNYRSERHRCQQTRLLLLLASVHNGRDSPEPERKREAMYAENIPGLAIAVANYSQLSSLQRKSTWSRKCKKNLVMEIYRLHSMHTNSLFNVYKADREFQLT